MLDHELLMDVLREEAFARCRYEIYGELARKEGLHYYAKIFEESSLNELSHFREVMKLLGLNGRTKANLSQAIENEAIEANRTYPQLHEEALIDGDLETARLFQQIAKIEARHQDRFSRLLKLLEEDSPYKREAPIIWKCRVCGFIYEGLEPPKKCPACQSPQSSFEPDDFSI